MLEFFLDFSVRYHIYVDFITHTFHLYTLSDRCQHKDSLITSKQTSAQKDHQNSVVVDSMNKKRKSVKIKYSCILLSANLSKIFLGLLKQGVVQIRMKESPLYFHTALKCRSKVHTLIIERDHGNNKTLQKVSREV